MAKKVDRAGSFKDYSSVKGKRRLEVCCFVLPVLIIVVVTVSLLISKQNSTVMAPCTINSSQYLENITDYLLTDEPFANGSLVTVDGMIYPQGYYWSPDKQTVWGCPCMLKPCISKCCDKYETHVYSEYVYGDYVERVASCENHHVLFDPKNSDVYSVQNLSILAKSTINDDHFFVINGDGNCSGRGMYLPDEDEREESYLLEDGRLYSTGLGKTFWDYTEFCVESSNDSDATHFMICFEEESKESLQEKAQQWTFYVRGYGMLISVPCLLITLLVYALLPQLNNLHGRSLICYVTCLTVGYLCLATVQVSVRDIPKPICCTLAFVIQFSLLTSFFWLNVMCFDIWWVFSGLMPLRGSQQAAEQFKFLMYSLYAWGCPSVIVTLSLIMEYAPGIPANAIKPEMGITKCFFKGDDAKLLYFYLPIGVLVYLNVVMFLTTALRFKSHSKSVKKLQRGDSRRHCQARDSAADMQRFSLYLKLFVVMGVNWVLELLAFFIQSDSLFWLVTDAGNALQGVLILYMFVCKRPIIRQIRERLSPRLHSFSIDSSVKTLTSTRTNSVGSGKVSSVRRKISEQSTASSCDTSV